jgi:hypothetical protein
MMTASCTVFWRLAAREIDATISAHRTIIGARQFRRGARSSAAIAPMGHLDVVDGLKRSDCLAAVHDLKALKSFDRGRASPER